MTVENQGVGGMGSAYLLLEISHTHYWTKVILIGVLLYIYYLHFDYSFDEQHVHVDSKQTKLKLSFLLIHRNAKPKINHTR